MSNRCAIYAPTNFHLPENPFGKDVANLGLFRAVARYSGFDEVCFLTHHQLSGEEIRRRLLIDEQCPTRVSCASILDPEKLVEAGALLRGKADLADLAWLRRGTRGDRAYSLIGLVHSIAPPAIRQYMAAAATAPVQSWDALICTSPVVRDAMRDMFDQWGEYLADRFGGSKRPQPHLPLLPLGVDGERIAAAADRKNVRSTVRTRLSLTEDDVLILWVGRLSFFEKAFPQPMFSAVEQAMGSSGRRLHLAMVGWFPNGEADRQRYTEAARLHAPSVPVHFLNGNKREVVDALWAGADIFLSLVDNIQETFGITPIEAMAAGLPVVASDWDGYRWTIEDGRQGFLVPTLGGPPGSGDLMLARHVLGIDSYQRYVGTVAQHTAVNVPAAVRALATLAQNPELRRRMGESGRARVRSQFSWPVVANQIGELVHHLNERRGRSDAFEGERGLAQKADPVKAEPFGAFSSFATEMIGGETSFRLSRPVPRAYLQRLFGSSLDEYGSTWRASFSETEKILSILDRGGPLTLKRTLEELPGANPKRVALTIMWLCKLDLLVWETSGAAFAIKSG
jgi:D-inositol-3-phosphate glycosyltransferase